MEKPKIKVVPITVGRRSSVPHVGDNAGQFRFDASRVISRTYRLASWLVESNSSLKNKSIVIKDKIERIGELNIDAFWSEEKIQEVEELISWCVEFLSLVSLEMIETGDLYSPDVALELLRIVDPVGSEEF